MTEITKHLPVIISRSRPSDGYILIGIPAVTYLSFNENTFYCSCYLDPSFRELEMSVTSETLPLSING